MALAVDRWHEIVDTGDMDKLQEFLHDDVVFFSPVVHTPQRGKPITAAYLAGANQVLNSNGFHYTGELIGERHAVLEFVTEIDGIHVNGIDIISWDEQDRVTEFKVMVRPLKAVNALHAAMGEMLAKMQAGTAQQ